MAWFLYRLGHGTDNTSIILNRIGSLVFFTAFSVIVAFWHAFAPRRPSPPPDDITFLGR